ncbi:MAG TPA: hemerythrin domain-containing protein [Candidatus Omnitrophota bacterium]|nr:hemerythrin domain-containing protein [Candidatus Omnitrophota bacterium]
MKTTNTITQYFEADHNRLDAIFHQFQKKKYESMAEAKPYFKSFNNGLKRHIVWEEDVLFPLFEEKSGIKDGGPTFVMREEHRRIGALLEGIHDKVRRGDSSSESEEEMLLEILNGHNQKEEQVLYPTMDQLLTEKEVAGIFVAMENIPAERYQTCCGGHH